MATSATTLDTINLRNFHTTAVIGPDAWGRLRKPQPIVLSLSLSLDTQKAGVSDDVEDTFSYGTMAKDIRAMLETSSGGYGSIEELVQGIFRVAVKWPSSTEGRLRIEVVAPKALLRCEGGLTAAVVIVRSPHLTAWTIEEQSVCMTGLKIGCIIGVNAHEREQKQNVAIDLSVQSNQTLLEMLECEKIRRDETQRGEGNALWRLMVRRVCEVAERTDFETLEALAAKVAMTCLEGEPACAGCGGGGGGGHHEG